MLQAAGAAISEQVIESGAAKVEGSLSEKRREIGETKIDGTFFGATDHDRRRQQLFETLAELDAAATVTSQIATSSAMPSVGLDTSVVHPIAPYLPSLAIDPTVPSHLHDATDAESFVPAVDRSLTLEGNNPLAVAKQSAENSKPEKKQQYLEITDTTKHLGKHPKFEN